MTLKVFSQVDKGKAGPHGIAQAGPAQVGFVVGPMFELGPAANMLGQRYGYRGQRFEQPLRAFPDASGHFIAM